MTRHKATTTDLHAELGDYRERFPKLSDDQIFVLWFLRAFVTDNEDEAASALTGGAGDKNVDAVLLDEQAKMVFVVQGKYRRVAFLKNEARNDVLEFAQLSSVLWGDAQQFTDFCQSVSPVVRDRLTMGRERLRRKYRLRLQYVTLGRCSKEMTEDAARIARRSDGPSDLLSLA